MIQTLGIGIWLADGGIVDFHGFPYPTRMVLVRLADGGLWVWSPVELTEEVRETVERLGRPTHLVSPNKLHHLYLGDWLAAWPGAKLWGPASAIKKRDDLVFEEPLDDVPPAAWNGVFDMVRFTGSPFMDEVVFFHRTSRTAILADLSENFDDEFLRSHWKPWQQRLAPWWGIVKGKGYAPLEWRLSFFRRKRLRAARDRVLAWNAETVVMAHGEWQRSGGRGYLERCFAWID